MLGQYWEVVALGFESYDLKNCEHVGARTSRVAQKEAVNESRRSPARGQRQGQALDVAVTATKCRRAHICPREKPTPCLRPPRPGRRSAGCSWSTDPKPSFFDIVFGLVKAGLRKTPCSRAERERASRGVGSTIGAPSASPRQYFRVLRASSTPRFAPRAAAGASHRHRSRRSAFVLSQHPFMGSAEPRAGAHWVS